MLILINAGETCLRDMSLRPFREEELLGHGKLVKGNNTRGEDAELYIIRKYT